MSKRPASLPLSDEVDTAPPRNRLRSRLEDHPEEVEKAQENVVRKGTGVASQTSPSPVPERQKTERMHFFVPMHVARQIRQRQLDRGMTTLREYYLTVLREAGEIDVTDAEIQDGRKRKAR